MDKFLIVDASHLFYRARYAVRGTADEKIGMALHILFTSLSKSWRTQKTNHIVFAFDGHSWRKDEYKPYKANRSAKRAKETPAQVAEGKLFFEAFDIFQDFIKTRTNCTVLEDSILEADDLIAGFIQSHPSDEHVIVSRDGDFEQLMASNVVIYNGIADTTTTMAGVFDYKGKPVIEKRTGLMKAAPNPEWSVFEKCMRGCSSDNIFSAYPGIREKGTKKKLGLEDAFEDRHKQGFDWSSVMHHHWTDPQGTEHKVFDDYQRNKILVDLTAQPDRIKTAIFETIDKSCVPLNRPQIGLYFLKFCGKYELVRLSDQANIFSQLLSAAYPNHGRKTV